MAKEFRFNCATGQTEEVDYTPPPVQVPPRINRYQFRRALSGVNAGKRAAFNTWLTTNATEEQQDYFLHSRWIERNHPVVEAARVAINVSQAAVNNLFIAALAFEE